MNDRKRGRFCGEALNKRERLAAKSPPLSVFCMCVMRDERGRGSEVDYGSDRLALVHQIERLVDTLERELVGDEWIQIELASEHLINYP